MGVLGWGLPSPPQCLCLSTRSHKPGVTPGPQSSHRLLSVLLLQKSGSMQDPSDPISGFLLLSIYTFSPLLAPAADLLQGLLPVQVLRGGQSHLFTARSGLRLQQRALGAASGWGSGWRGRLCLYPSALG